MLKDRIESEKQKRKEKESLINDLVCFNVDLFIWICFEFLILFFFARFF